MVPKPSGIKMKEAHKGKCGACSDDKTSETETLGKETGHIASKCLNYRMPECIMARNSRVHNMCEVVLICILFVFLSYCYGMWTRLTFEEVWLIPPSLL